MARQRHILTLRLQSPLLPGAAQAIGNTREAQEIIPGRTMRGALAATLRTTNPEQFNAFFEGDEQPHFGPLFPSNKVDDVFVPLPTRTSCKRSGGNARDGGTDDKHHGVFDTLIRQYALEAALTGGKPVPILDELRCPVCAGETESYGRTEVSVQRINTTHVALNRARRAAEESLLYSRQGIVLEKADYVYTGYVDVPETLVEPLAEILQALPIRLGANRSRGMGMVQTVGLRSVIEGETEIQARVETFNQRLAANLRFYQRLTGDSYLDLPAADANRYFTIDLHGSAILAANGLAARDPVLSGVSVVRRWIDWQVEGGWHAAASLPRRSVMTVRGVYLCRFESETPDYAKLTELERDGLGLRREAGYGQLTICHAAHAVTGL